MTPFTTANIISVKQEDNGFRNKQKECFSMKKGIKKAIAYSLLVGMTQFGLAATATIEASPRGDWKQQQNDQRWQENNRHKQEMQRRHNENARDWNDRQWRENQQHERYDRQDNEREYQRNLEIQRHEREMARRDYENAQDWNDRQWRENQRHDNTMNELFAGVLGVIIGANL